MIKVYKLHNKNGIEVTALNFGGIIHSIKIPNRDGSSVDIVLGLNSYNDYLSEVYTKENPYFGGIIGRCSNIIKDGTFVLEGKAYILDKNYIEHNLHGGSIGFDKVFWTSEMVLRENNPVLKLSYLSKDMEEGFPGNLEVMATYELTDENELIIDYLAKTDKKTVVNLTNHTYFNLKGEGNGNILDHILYINSDTYTENNKDLVPTGLLKKVQNTPLDFRKPKTIGSDIHSAHDQLIYGNGYDQNFCLKKRSENSLEIAATVEEPVSGRRMEVFTTSPGLQLYTGNCLNENIIGKQNRPYFPKAGFCLETQAFPDSPNNPHFPKIELSPKQEYRQTTVYRFSTNDLLAIDRPI
ncbi:aldose epimerase family protein [Flagellimonas pacifica]|uniref:Aldose 1-epimerase n=1 Tax=Flagellimonas pacifica TaxID=1247520 RepID=A0A285MXD1_9FLAO|nr:aldose epimerase family protein [Allomuricauda parva]SNZ01748.1 aldose 1-epimerase [Allomuricauda parva]